MELKNYFIQDSTGNALVGALCYLYLPGTTTQVTGILGATGLPLSNPMTSGARGLLQFSCANGRYDLKVVKDALAYTMAVQCSDTLEASTILASGTGSNVIGFLQSGTGAVPRTVQSKQRDIVSIKDFGAICDGTSHFLSERFSTLASAQAAYPHATALTNEIDWAAAQAAFNTGASPYFPGGDCMVHAPLVSIAAGQVPYGEGPFRSTIKATTAFVGSSVLILGDKNTIAITGATGAKDLDINCNSIDGVSGLEAYGLRDGTSFNGIYVTNNKNAPGIKTNMAGNGTGSAGGKMCEGVQFLNCHVITSNDMTNVSYWQLDGLFESQLIGCKALGSSGAAVTGSKGFRLGSISEVRGVTMLGCSVGNLAGAGSNTGIYYGEWARESWDQFTTFENIVGSGVYFHGSSVSGTLLPFNCQSLNPRPYISATAGVLDPLYRFGDSNACFAGPVMYYSSSKTWGKFDAPVGSQFNNTIEIFAGVVPTDLLTTIINFDAASSTSNFVTGLSSDAVASRKRISFNKGGATERYEGNGFSEQNDSFWTTFNLGTPNKFRFRSNTASGATSLLELDGAAGTVTPQARLVTGQAYSSANLLSLGTYRLWVDSFSRLRIKNGAPTTAADGAPISQRVAVPATAASAGSPGDWSSSSTFFYTYVGDGTSHSWVRCALATW